MALFTQCPHCHTLFKVVADQLRVCNGLVRCGECTQVFDGRANLLPEEPPVLTPMGPSSEPVYVARPAPLGSRPAFAPLAEPNPEPNPEPAPQIQALLRVRRPIDLVREREQEARETVRGGVHDGAREEPRISQPIAQTVVQTMAQPIAPSISQPFIAEDDPAPEDEPIIAAERRAAPPLPAFLEERRTYGRLWALLFVLIVLGLGLYGVYMYRTALANVAPPLRPLLTQVCQRLQCKVGYTRNIERIQIVSSALRPQPVPEPAANGGSPASGATASTPPEPAKMLLSVVLRNRSNQPQDWPTLTLELTDVSDTVVARKLIPPESYLPPGAVDGPFAPNAEAALSVQVEVNGVHVNGFQIGKFFP